MLFISVNATNEILDFNLFLIPLFYAAGLAEVPPLVKLLQTISRKN